MTKNEQYFSVNEVAEKFGVNPKTVFRHVREGKIPAFKIGGQWRIAKSQLDKYIEENHNGKK